MQIGIRLHDTKKGTLEERVAIAEEQGFSCAHLALKKVISEYSVADSALTPGFSCYLKNLFAAHHLDIAVLGCYLNLATPDQAALERTYAAIWRISVWHRFWEPVLWEPRLAL